MQFGGGKPWRRRGGQPQGHQGNRDRWSNSYDNRYDVEEDNRDWDRRNSSRSDSREWRNYNRESPRASYGHNRHRSPSERSESRHRSNQRFQDRSASPPDINPSRPDIQEWNSPEESDASSTVLSPRHNLETPAGTDWKTPPLISIEPEPSPKLDKINFPASGSSTAGIESQSGVGGNIPIQNSFSPPPNPLPSPSVNSQSDYQSVVDLANKITSLGPLIRDPRLLSRVLKIQQQGNSANSNPLSPEKGKSSAVLPPTVKDEFKRDKEIAKSITAACEMLSGSVTNPASKDKTKISPIKSSIKIRPKQSSAQSLNEDNVASKNATSEDQVKLQESTSILKTYLNESNSDILKDEDTPDKSKLELTNPESSTSSSTTPTAISTPVSRAQSLVKDSFLKLKQEKRAKMSAPSKYESKQNQALLKLVMDSGSSSTEMANQQRPGNPPPFTKHPGLKSILNTVMKTSISNVLRSKMDAHDAKTDSKVKVNVIEHLNKVVDESFEIEILDRQIDTPKSQKDDMGAGPEKSKDSENEKSAKKSIVAEPPLRETSNKDIIKEEEENKRQESVISTKEKTEKSSEEEDPIMKPEHNKPVPSLNIESPKSEELPQLVKKTETGLMARTNTARKGCSVKQTPPSDTSPKSPKEAQIKTKRGKRRHFRGATYGLYLSTKTKKKRNKKSSKSPDASVQGEESSVTGTETTGSFADSTDEGSCRSEDLRTNSSGRSFHGDESPPKLEKEIKDSSPENESSQVSVENVTDQNLESDHRVKIKMELEDTSGQIDDGAEQLDDEQSTDTLLSAPMTLVAKKSIPSKALKDGLESIALSVKSRQRKRRVMDECLTSPIQEELIYLSENGPQGKKPRRNSTAPNSGLKVMVNLANDINCSIPKTESFYDPDLQVLMCSCQAKPLGSTTDEAVNSKIYCQAIDTIDEKLVGCCNEVSTHQLFRPSVKIPFTAMCEVHLWRLRHHQCCPVCGIFCSQGIFLQCNASAKGLFRNHLFHKECKITLKNLDCCLCPHCGCDNKMKEVSLELNTPTASSFYLTQKALVTEPLARMTFCRLSERKIEVEDNSLKSFEIADSGKVLSSAGLPSGADREQLESMLDELDSEKLSIYSTQTPQQLYIAAKNGEVQNVLYMLAFGSDPNLKFPEHGGDTALHAAAANGHLVTVHLLFQSGASVDHLNTRLYTPLMVAIESRQLVTVQYLIKVGAQLTAKGEDGTTAIHLAARCGNLDICKVLLNTGRSMPNIQDDGGWTPIVWACEHSHLDLVKLLIERGADPNIRDNEENVALHWSAYSGNVDISQILLDLGCDIQVVNEHGDTPLHIASRQNNYESVVLFLARGAAVDIRNKEDEIPLKCCADPNSPACMALMMNSKLKRFSMNRSLAAEKVIHRDITRGKEQNPIQCVNGVDEEAAPFDFLYIVKNCETSPINIDRTITSLQSCQCEDDCTSSNCTCATISFKCWYDNEGRLLPEFNMPDPPMIFECNRACTCWKSCNNRVLQHGILSRLQLFRTKGKGWGVRTLKDIPRGTFICEYIGEVISDSEADQREDDSYLFDLDNRDGETYCLDARYYGNISRFVNHLCEPNLVPVKVFVEHQDLSFPRIAFFSSRDIKAGEELGFDYGEKFWVIKYKWFTCACSSLHCKYSKDTIQHTLELYYRRLREDHHEEDVESVPQLL